MELPASLRTLIRMVRSTSGSSFIRLAYKLRSLQPFDHGRFQRVPPVVHRFYYIEKNGFRLLGFQATLLKLLPEVLLTILIGVLSEAGRSENFGLP